MKTAIVTGITGQDGSYLAELLLEKDYQVIGIKRRSSTDTLGRVAHLEDHPNFEVVEGDITDNASMTGVISEYRPDEFYNLAAMSHVGTSFKQPHLTFHTDAVGVLNILEAIRVHHPSTRFYQASTSEMFGSNYSTSKLSSPDDDPQSKRFAASSENTHMPELATTEAPTEVVAQYFQDEKTPLAPNSPYAVAKVAGHNLVHVYRESYGIFAAAGILFNHESPRRGENFVTRKITKWIGDFNRWKIGKTIVSAVGDDIQAVPASVELEDMLTAGKRMSFNFDEMQEFPKLRLGNLDACRDWGHARDYCQAMHSILQQEEPEDFVIATGETYSVKDFLTEAFGCINVDNWKKYVVIDPAFYRPCEVEFLLGNATKARTKLEWTPDVSFKELVREMVEHDVKCSAGLS